MHEITDPILEDYSKMPEGNWLNEFDWKSVKLGKLPFVIDGVFVAMYLAEANKVLLENPETTEVTFDIWATDLIHEMYHAYQRHTMGLFKYLLFKIFRRKKLEEEAENASLKWLEMNGCNIKKDF